MKSTMQLLLVLAWVPAVVTCASTQKPKATEWTAQDYWPLAVGNSWTYRISHGGMKQEAAVKITSQNPEGFFLDSQGGALKKHPAGIFDGQRFLVRDPVEVGNKWIAVPSANSVERFEIVSKGFTATVPAGVFENCILVRCTNRVNKDEVLVVESTYAPGIGMIQYASSYKKKGETAKNQVGMVLLKFAPGSAAK